VNYYELMVILTPVLTEEQEKEQHHLIEELLKSQNAEIHLVDFWGKRKLAYAIKKQRQGVYNWYYFEVTPDRVAEIERKLKMSEQILRFLMFRMEKIQIQSLHKEITRRKEAAAAPPPAPAVVATSEPAIAEPVAESTEEITAETPAAPETTTESKEN
jgi:small subunit ribosomal protein S6